MLENIGLILGGLAVLGALVLGYVAWRAARRREDAEREVPLVAPLGNGGAGGPKEPA